MTPKRIGLGLLILLLVVGGVSLYKLSRIPPDPQRRGEEAAGSEDHLGKSKTLLIQEYGTPNLAWDGHYGNLPADYVKRHSPCITLVYRGDTGTLYLSFEQKDDDWVCFSSQWLPKGAAF